MKTMPLWIALIASTLLAGCATSSSGQVYTREQTRRAMSVQLGTVEFVKSVRVEGSKSGLGAAIGGVVGGVGGGTVGGGKGSTLAALGGAAVGALAGHVAEGKLTELDGVEITVKLDDGQVIAVVQEADLLFAVGDRVRVLTDPHGTVRVEK